MKLYYDYDIWSKNLLLILSKIVEGSVAEKWLNTQEPLYKGFSLLYRELAEKFEQGSNMIRFVLFV